MRTILLVTFAAVACSSSQRTPASPADAEANSNSSVVPRAVLDVAVRDSEVFRPRHMGVLYRYGSGDRQRDVYVYPKASWPDPTRQARIFVDALEIERRRGRFDRYEVLTNVPFNIEILGRVFAAHEVTFRVTRRGEDRNSYFAVVSLPDRYLKVRISRKPDSDDGRPRDFVRAWVLQYLGVGQRQGSAIIDYVAPRSLLLIR